jgi:hypothetical protein
VIIGDNFLGQNLLDAEDNPFRKYAVTDLEAVRYPVNTQTLVAINTQEHRAIALFGSFPFDLTESRHLDPEYSMIKIYNYNACVLLYNQFNQLSQHP